VNCRFSAPGKLVLLGEYAVIDGAPALVAAVDRRAAARVEAIEGVHCEIDAPDVWLRPARFALSAAGRMTGRAGSGEARRHALPRFILKSLIAEGKLDPATVGAFRLSLDSAGFFLDGKKLGLGSSAALVVAADAALRRYAGAEPAPHEGALDRLILLHAAFQHNRGSGLDVAASLTGGLLSFERGGAARARVEALRWPPGLQMVCLWSGRPASTQRLLRAAEQARRSRPRAYAAHLAPLARLAEAGRDAARAGDAAGLVSVMGSYADAMGSFGRACGIDIMRPGHRRLRQLAAATGTVYKPSGAGGGDVGIAIATAGEPLAALCEAAAREGYAEVPLQVDTDGLRSD
jgi:phosphomevalonate kinase